MSKFSSTAFWAELRRFFAAQAVLALGSLVWVSAADGLPGNGIQDPKETFRQLLASPAAFEELVFREKLPPSFNRPVPRDVGVKFSTNYGWYQLRWKTNAMLVRSMASTNELGTANIGKVAFTLLNGTFTFLDGGTNAFVYQLEHERARRGEVPPSYDAAWYRISRFGEILNLGLSHLWPGSVRWVGDDFSAQGIADKKPIFVSGRISGLTNGIPSELSVIYSNNVGVARYRIAYQYNTCLAAHFPSRVSLFFQGRGPEIEYRTYDVLSVKTAPHQEVADALFSPIPLLRTSGKPLRYLTNNSVFMKLPSGRLLETPGASPKVALTKQDYYQNRYVYAALAIVSVGFLRVGLRPSSHGRGRERNP